MPMPGCSTRFCFEIRTAKRVYNLGVDSEEQMDKWLRALQRAISGHRSRLSVQPGSREEVVPASLRTAVESPLGRAVWQGDTKEVDEIINRESQLLNSKLDSSNTPLHLAVLRGNNTIIEKLLLRHADFACTFELINFSGADPLVVNALGQNALHLATGKHLRLVKALLSSIYGNKLLSSFTPERLSPLHCAILGQSEERVDIVKELLSKYKNYTINFNQSRNIDVNATDSKQRTAMHLVCSRHDSRLLDVLLPVCKKTLNALDADSNTPLHCAMKSFRSACWDPSLVKKLVEAGAGNY